MTKQNRIREYDDMQEHDDFSWVGKHGVTWWDIQDRAIYPACTQKFREFRDRHVEAGRLRIWATSDKPNAKMYYHIDDIYACMEHDTQENLRRRQSA